MALPSSWLTRLSPETARTRVRLICAPYAGGSSSSFRRWCSRLPPDIALYATELPGRGSRFAEPCLQSVDEVVTQLVEALRPLLDQPFALFGHSLGVLIVYELALQIQRLAISPPVRVIISGQRAFDRPSPRPPIHELSDQEFLKEVDRYGGTPPGLFEDEELRNMFLPVLRADFTLGETYVHRQAEQLNFDLCAYGGWEDDEVSLDDIKAWEPYTSGHFRYRMFPGSHFFLHQHEELFLENLMRDLEF